MTANIITIHVNIDSAPPGDDCVRTVTDGNDDVCPMGTRTHTHAKHTSTYRHKLKHTHTGIFEGSYEINGKYCNV